MGHWDEKAKNDAVQSGTGPGEFGPDYSDRKRYQLKYGKENLVNTHRNPRQSPYPSHVVEAYREPIIRFMDPDFGPDQLKDTEEN